MLFRSPSVATNVAGVAEADEVAEDKAVDLEVLGQDQIAKLIIGKFKGHGMARVVEAILRAQGYATYRSPEGPDKGVDILASTGSLGFGPTRICVQVKSEESQIERVILDQLIGAMHNFKANQGLLVAWGGFKKSIERERATQFFNVRLWDQHDLISELLAVYDKLPEEFRAEIPLKRIWTVTTPEEAD